MLTHTLPAHDNQGHEGVGYDHYDGMKRGRDIVRPKGT